MTTLTEYRITEFNTCYAHYTKDELSAEDYNSKWTKRFFVIPDADLIDLFSAAEQDGHQLLMNTIARRLAELIEEYQDPESLRKWLDLPDDLTDQQKETVRKEYGQIDY